MPHRIGFVAAGIGIVALLAGISFSAAPGPGGWGGDPTPPTASTPSTPAAPDSRTPVPTQAQIDPSIRQIRELLAEQYDQAHKAPAPLVAKLMELADSTKDDPAGRYACLSEARRVASEKGLAGEALSAGEKMIEQYKVHPRDCRSETLAAAEKHARTPEARAALAEGYFKMSSKDVAKDDYAQAASALAKARSLAYRSGDKDLIGRVTDEQKRVVQLKVQAAKIVSARATLKVSPADPQANQDVGKFLCFVKGDWATGLQHLLKGSSVAWKAAAQKDLAQPADGSGRLDVANQWYTLGKSNSDGAAKKGLMLRAGFWYSQAIPDLTGLAKLMAEKRLKETGYETDTETETAGGDKKIIAKFLKDKTLLFYFDYEKKSFTEKAGKTYLKDLGLRKNHVQLTFKPKLEKAKRGSGLLFNQGGDLQEIQVSGEAPILPGRSFTLMTWFRMDKFPAEKCSPISLGSSFALQIGNIGFGENAEKGLSADYMGAESQLQSVAWNKFGRIAQPLQEGQWVHAAAVSDEKSFHLYVNGVKNQWLPVKNPPRPLGKTVFVGSSYIRQSQFALNGMLDETSCFARALSDGEIRDHFLATGGKLDPKDLVDLTETQVPAETAEARKQAISILAKVEAIKGVSGRTKKELRDFAAELATLGLPAIKTLLKGTQHENNAVQIACIQALGYIGHYSATPTVIKALQAKGNQFEKSAAARALGEIGDKRATDALLEELKGDNRKTISMIGSALGKIGDAKALPALKTLLKKHEKDPKIQRWIGLAIERIEIMNSK